MLVVRLDGLNGVRGENATTTVIIPKRKVTEMVSESVIDAGIQKISKIPEKNVVLARNNQVKEHYVVDFNLKPVIKLIVLHVITVLVIWSVFGQIGANGVNALRSVAMDIASGNGAYIISYYSYKLYGIPLTYSYRGGVFRRTR